MKLLKDSGNVIQTHIGRGIVSFRKRRWGFFEMYTGGYGIYKYNERACACLRYMYGNSRGGTK
jgi:hypothetical protein